MANIIQFSKIQSKFRQPQKQFPPKFSNVLDNLINILNLTYRTSYLDDHLDIRFEKEPGVHKSSMDRQSFPHPDVMFVYERDNGEILIHFDVVRFIEHVTMDLTRSMKKDRVMEITSSPDGLALEFAATYASLISTVKQKTYRLSKRQK